MQKNLIKKKYGFTLAEILVTLSIIGVIASMTIPNLVQDIQDAQYKTAWKKAYAELSQATQRILLDNAGSLIGVFPDYKSSFNKEYVKYLNYTKACAYGQTRSNYCWHKHYEYKYLSGEGVIWEDTTGLVLSNGALIRFDGRLATSETCTETVNSGAFQGICGWINVDINGFKGPNTLGKDIFDAWILKDRLMPFGVPNDSNYCSGLGRGCSAAYLSQ